MKCREEGRNAGKREERQGRGKKAREEGRNAGKREERLLTGVGIVRLSESEPAHNTHY